MPPPPSGPGDLVPGPADFDAIEGAVMETARGRWFLAEFARRHRQSDTVAVLAAIGRLEQEIAAERRLHRAGAPSMAALAEAVARGRAEIAAVGPADEALTDRITATAERLQELAWNLRETGSDEEACAAIEAGAASVYAVGAEAARLTRRARLACGVIDMLDERLAVDPGAGEAALSPPSPRRDSYDAGGSPEALSGLDETAGTVVPMRPARHDALPRDEDRSEGDEPEGDGVVGHVVDILPPRGGRPLRLPAIPTLVSSRESAAPRASVTPPVSVVPAEITLADIEALSFEEKVALFS